MKRIKNFSQKISNYTVLLALLSILFSYGCQKDKLNETIADTTTATSSMSIEETTIQLIYGVQVSEFSKADIDNLYHKIMDGLSTEQQSEIDEYVQQYLQPSVTSATNDNVSFRSMRETLMPGGNLGDEFGATIAKTGNTMFVGAPGKDRVYAYDGDGLVQNLRSSRGGEGFGSTLTASGDWMAASSIGEIVLFKNENGSWVEQQVLTPDFAFVGGTATGNGMIMDGNQLVIMARGFVAENSVLIYELKEGVWTKDGEIDLGILDIFLWDIDMSNGVIVGNGGTQVNSQIVFNPQVYIMDKSSGSWGISNQVAFPPGYILARAVAVEGSTIIANTAFGPLGATNSIVITGDGGNWSVTGALVQPGPLPFAQTRKIDMDGSRVVITVPTGGFASIGGDLAHVFDGGVLTETLSPGDDGLKYLYGESVYVQGKEIGIGAPAGSGDFGDVFIYTPE